MDRGAWQAAVNRVARVRHDLATKIPPTTQNMFDELRKKKKNKQTTATTKTPKIPFKC